MVPKLLKRLLLVVAILVALQDTTGLFFNETHQLKYVRNHHEHPEILEFKMPDENVENSDRLKKQIKVYQDGKQLTGPFVSITPLKTGGPGGYVVRKRLLLIPFDGLPDPAQATFTLWQPAQVSPWLTAPLYVGVLLLLLLPWTFRYHLTHPIPHNKIASLESARGIACMLVVFSHFFIPVYSQTLNATLPPDMSFWHIVALHRELPLIRLLTSGSFAVFFFFILSGYVLALPFLDRLQSSGDRFRIAIIRRPLRLLGVVVVIMLISYFLQQGGFYYQNYHKQAVPWPTFLNHLSLAYTYSTEYNNVFWTIRYELWGALGVYVFLWLLGGTRLRWVGYTLCFFLSKDSHYQAFLYGVVMADVLKPSWRYGLPPSWAGKLAPYLLVLGLLLGSYESPDKSSYERLMSGLLEPIRSYIQDGQFMIGAALILFSILSWPRLQKALSKPFLLLLGRWSFTIYAIHSLVFFTLGYHLLVTLHPDSAQYIYYFMSDGFSYHVSVLASFAVSMLLIFIISAWLTAAVDEPCVRLSRRIAEAVSKREQATSEVIIENTRALKNG